MTSAVFSKSRNLTIALLAAVVFLFWSSAHGFLPVAPLASGSDDCALGAEKAAFLSTPGAMKKFAQALEFSKAAVELRVRNTRKSVGQVCSGTLVSDSGHVLTAQHCFSACLKKSGPRDVFESKDCQILVNGKETRFTVEMMSPCGSESIAQLRSYQAQDMSIPDALKHCDGVGDLAVLRLHQPPEDFKCLTVTTSNTRASGQPVLSLGFPGPTQRGRDDSKGEGLYFSFGETVQRDFCEIEKRSSLPFVSRTERRGLTPTMQIIREDYLQTTVDYSGGSSGSGLIDEQDEIVGVAAIGDFANEPKVECKGSFFFEKTTRLYDTARAARSKFNPDSLRCQERRVTRRSGGSR